MSQMDDAELLAEAARGNRDAFATFYRRHLALVVAFCARATGDRELGADLTGEVFAAALEACGRYRREYETAAPWLIGSRRTSCGRASAVAAFRTRCGGGCG